MLFRYLKSSFWFWFGGIWALVGTLLLIAGVVAGLGQKHLEERGVRTEARIVDMYTTSDSDGATRYKLMISYRDGAGSQHRREVGVDRSEFGKLHEEGYVEMVYDPQDPSEVALAGNLATPWWVWTLVSGAFAGAFAGVGWGLVLRELGRTRRRISLLRKGTPIRGEVVRVEQDLMTRVNNRHPNYVVYAFTGPDGVRRVGRSLNLPRDLEARFSLRAPLTVAYDPLNPDRHEPDVFGVLSLTGELESER